MQRQQQLPIVRQFDNRPQGANPGSPPPPVPDEDLNSAFVGLRKLGRELHAKVRAGTESVESALDNGLRDEARKITDRFAGRHPEDSAPRLPNELRNRQPAPSEGRFTFKKAFGHFIRGIREPFVSIVSSPDNLMIGGATAAGALLCGIFAGAAFGTLCAAGGTAYALFRFARAGLSVARAQNGAQVAEASSGLGKAALGILAASFAPHAGFPALLGGLIFTAVASHELTSYLKHGRLR